MRSRCFDGMCCSIILASSIDLSTVSRPHMTNSHLWAMTLRPSNSALYCAQFMIVQWNGFESSCIV